MRAANSSREITSNGRTTPRHTAAKVVTAVRIWTRRFPRPRDVRCEVGTTRLASERASVPPAAPFRPSCDDQHIARLPAPVGPTAGARPSVSLLTFKGGHYVESKAYFF